MFKCPGCTRGGIEGSTSPKLDLTTDAEYVANVVMSVCRRKRATVQVLAAVLSCIMTFFLLIS